MDKTPLTSIASVIGDIRSFFFAGFQTFPLTLAGAMLIIGLMTANYALLFFLIGMLIGVPVLVSVFNAGVELIGQGVFGSMAWFEASSTDICQLAIPFGRRVGPKTTTDAASNWTAMTAFFIGYVITNAIAILNIKSVEISGATDVEKARVRAGEGNRRSQAIMAILSSAVLAVIFFGTRMFRTGCESTAGLLLTVAVFSVAGAGWYYTLASTAEGRLADILGIANRILAPRAMINKPVACMPVGE